MFTVMVSGLGEIHKYLKGTNEIHAYTTITQQASHGADSGNDFSSEKQLQKHTEAE